MRVLSTCSVAIMILIGSNAAIATTPQKWPVNPSRLQLDTPYGELHVSPSEYVYESRLMLKGQEIDPLIQGLLNIPYAFSSPDYHVALISVSAGDDNCPIVYQWIRLQENGYTVTPKFGSCSEFIKVSTQGTDFKLQTPNNEDPDKLDTYTYDGKTVQKKTSLSH